MFQLGHQEMQFLFRRQRLFETLRKLKHKHYLFWYYYNVPSKKSGFFHINSTCRDQIRLSSSFTPSTNYHKVGFPNKCLQCTQPKLILFLKTRFFWENLTALHLIIICVDIEHFGNKKLSNKGLQGIPPVLTHLA